MTWRLHSQTPTRDARWWLGLGMLVSGAALTAYLLDPDEGNARRRRLADQVGHRMRTAGRQLSRTGRYAIHTLVGRARHILLDGRPRFADDQVLLDRVESELYADPKIPQGRMNLEVDGLTVVMRGELDSLLEIEKVERAVGRIPGVGGIRSYLHLPGTPAPNKLTALSAEAYFA